MKEKKFHIGDVLSITTGKLVSERGMVGIFDILNFMSGEDLYVHQLSRVSQEAALVLFRRYKFLEEIHAPEKFSGETHVQSWLDEMVKIYSSMLVIPKMNENEHEYREPLSELAEKVHPDNILVLRLK